MHMWQIEQVLSYHSVMVGWGVLLVCVADGADRCYSGRQSPKES